MKIQTDFEISVRELAEFVHRKGGLGSEKQFRRPNRALEGLKGHQKLQQLRGDDYQAEVSVERVFTQDGVKLRVVGRVDGLIEGLQPFVEEIKTVDSHWSKQADPVHRAQLRLYGGLLTLDKHWTHVSLQLTYWELESQQTTVFCEEFLRDPLIDFLQQTVQEWFSWLLPYAEWLKKREESIASIAFPFQQFRTGQRDLAKSVYRSIRDHKNAFIEAPTGMGKTAATLFPSLKAFAFMGEGKVFYLTAKNSGKIAVEETLHHFRKAGLRIRSLTLTAKSKICLTEKAENCNQRVCPFSSGYYDRIKPALRELLEADGLDQETLSGVALKHQVCPFELSLDISRWMDIVIADYNYFFDPTVSLQRYFEGKPKHVVLVDEAHNLVDRSREMYSASLQPEDLELNSGAASGKGSGKARAALTQARKAFLQILDSSPEATIPPRSHHEGAISTKDKPTALMDHLFLAAQSIENYLVQQPPGVDVSAWLQPWFAINGFLRVGDVFDASYRTVINPAKQRLTFFCLDPTPRLSETLKKVRSAIFFSATLTPLDYFCEVLGGSGQDFQQSFISPFLQKQMSLRIAPLDVTFQGRSRSIPSVAQALLDHVQRTPGNHLIFCPSLHYLEQLNATLTDLGLLCRIQTPSMTEDKKTEFLNQFGQSGSAAGLAVLGGVFSEGIDLPGDRLVGVSVIGVGLPGLSIERDLLVCYYNEKGKSGFDYAYRYPGMQRVLQAVGRLIRTEQDYGSAILIDRRFLEQRYRRLFPRWWPEPTVG